MNQLKNMYKSDKNPQLLRRGLGLLRNHLNDDNHTRIKSNPILRPCGEYKQAGQTCPAANEALRT
ncbi:hypothetical protein PFDG_04778, partial [Plasmodium falciparum Dd2]